MSMVRDIRAFFVEPKNLGRERTLEELAADINCENRKAIGIGLWAMAAQTNELKREKNDAGKWVYRYNPKFKSSGGGRPLPAKKPWRLPGNALAR